eukprot:TRINITY_DN66244_c0_g1_i1.p1 TRINITY_DN66244_c0_g1~~TRINITY_DN66244_c0_g1_i1.p1  ORF type:complete len:255 (+),score=43.13 TRINITY_DN66244_c0_g1_i1:73-765(+)
MTNTITRGNNLWYTAESGERSDLIKTGQIRETPRGRLAQSLWEKRDKYEQTRYRTIGTTESRDSYVNDCTDIRHRDWQLRFAHPSTDPRRHPDDKGPAAAATQFPPLHFGSHPRPRRKSHEERHEREITAERTVTAVPPWVRKESSTGSAVPPGRYYSFTPARSGPAEVRAPSLTGFSSTLGYQGHHPKLAPKGGRSEVRGTPPHSRTAVSMLPADSVASAPASEQPSAG